MRGHLGGRRRYGGMDFAAKAKTALAPKSSMIYGL